MIFKDLIEGDKFTFKNMEDGISTTQIYQKVTETIICKVEFKLDQFIERLDFDFQYKIVIKI
jgi:hypothetical protein